MGIVIALIFGYIILYFVKEYVYAFINSILQIAIMPTQHFIDWLETSQAPLARLNQTKKVLNFLIGLAAILMIFAEFGALKTSLEAVYPAAPITLLGVKVSFSTLSSIVYIAVATFLGFFAIEWFGIRIVLQKILLNDSSDEVTKHETWQALGEEFKKPYFFFKMILAVLFLIALFIFAYWQGQLAVARDIQLVGSGKSNVTHDPSRAISFLLGFFTPIIAAIALVTIDIFVGVCAKIIIFILNFVLKIVSAIYLFFVALIELFVAPLSLILGRMVGANILATGTGTEILQQRTNNFVQPLQNPNENFAYNQSTMQRLYTGSDRLIFVCNDPPVREVIPSNEFPIDSNSTFQDIETKLQTKHSVLANKNIIFSYVNLNNGTFSEIAKNDQISRYFRVTDSIDVQIQ
jgi:hypothetical protein